MVVIGCGIAGAAVAYELARRSLKLFVLEAATPSGGTDVGHVRIGLGEPYGEAVSRFGREAAREIWELHRASRLRLEHLLPSLGRDCGYRCAGGFRLVESRPEALLLGESEDLLREDGFSGEFFDHYMLEARFVTRGFAAGYWAADDAELDATALVGGLLAAAEQAGASVHTRSPVVELELSASGAVAVTEPGARVSAALAVVTAGVGSARLLPWLTDRLVVRRERRLRLHVRSPAAVPSPGSARGRTLAWRATSESLLVRGAGTAESLAVGWPVRPGRILEVVDGATAATRDGLPLVGRLPDRPALAAVGFGGASLGIAFEAAHWIAETAAGRDAIPILWRADRG